MQEQFHSRPGEIIPGSKNPPLKPSIGKEVRNFEAQQEAEDSLREQAEALRNVTEGLLKSNKEKSDPISGVRLSRKPNPLPDSPLSASGAGNIEIDVDVNHEDPNDHEWKAA